MDETLKRKAYLEGSRLKNAGYSIEVISARLEKQGVPEELIKQIIINLSIQEIKDADKKATPFFNIALIKIGIGIVLAVISMLIVPGQIYLPIGLIVTGIIAAFINKKDMI